MGLRAPMVSAERRIRSLTLPWTPVTAGTLEYVTNIRSYFTIFNKENV